MGQRGPWSADRRNPPGAFCRPLVTWRRMLRTILPIQSADLLSVCLDCSFFEALASLNGSVEARRTKRVSLYKTKHSSAEVLLSGTLRGRREVPRSFRSTKQVLLRLPSAEVLISSSENSGAFVSLDETSTSAFARRKKSQQISDQLD